MALAVASSLAVSACTSGAQDGAPEPPPVQRGVEPPTIAAALARLPEFSAMRRLAQTGGTAAELADPRRSVTLLAARDTAFARLPPEQRSRLLQSTPETVIGPAMRSMMLPRIISSEEMRTRIIEGGGSFVTPSMAGSALQFRLNGDQIIVTAQNGASANMGNSALTTGNGVIYILDQWIGPVS